jgi:hypothetical protein
MIFSSPRLFRRSRASWVVYAFVDLFARHRALVFLVGDPLCAIKMKYNNKVFGIVLFFLGGCINYNDDRADNGLHCKHPHCEVVMKISFRDEEHF